jgi:hypothetical protein
MQADQGGGFKRCSNCFIPRSICSRVSSMDLVCILIMIIRGASTNPRTRVRAMDFEMNIRYADNSLSINSEEMKQLQSCAAENNIVVCLGYSERKGNSLYIGQCTIDNNGELVMSRRKLKPVHMERTLFGDGNGPSLNNVATTGVGRVGQLSCAVCTLQTSISFSCSYLFSNYKFLLILT